MRLKIGAFILIIVISICLFVEQGKSGKSSLATDIVRENQREAENEVQSDSNFNKWLKGREAKTGIRAAIRSKPGNNDDWFAPRTAPQNSNHDDDWFSATAESPKVSPPGETKPMTYDEIMKYFPLTENESVNVDFELEQARLAHEALYGKQREPVKIRAFRVFAPTAEQFDFDSRPQKNKFRFDGNHVFGIQQITPNVYGLGTHSNQYGQPVKYEVIGQPNANTDLLQVKPNGYGLGAGMDQYGRSVGIK